MSYVSPSCPPSGYSFVAAATLFRNFGGLAVYVKYKDGPMEIKIKRATPDYVWFVCPDRELVICTESFYTDSFYPWGDGFDECHDFTLFNDHACKHLGLEYVMTNYVHSKGSRSERWKAKTKPEDRVHVLSDSGGLQMSRGVTSAFSPADLMNFYNDNVDAGMCLDMPAPAAVFQAVPDIYQRLARIQKANNEVMLSMSKGAELINIFHGNTLERRLEYMRVVEDERIPRVALGGLGAIGAGAAGQHLTSALNLIYSTLLESRYRYKQYHILGVYTAPMVAAMVKIANTGDDPRHLTSDSTSHIQSASNRAYHFQFDMFGISKRLPIGSRSSEPNPHRYLPCPCPVCKVLKYMDILGFGDNRYVNELLSLHNAVEMARYGRMLQDVARNSSSAEYNDVVLRMCHNSGTRKELKNGLEFIDTVNKYGLPSARKRFASLLDRGRNVVQAPAALFEGLTRSADEPIKASSAEVVSKFMDSVGHMEAQVGIKHGSSGAAKAKTKTKTKVKSESAPAGAGKPHVKLKSRKG